jgi:predicted RNA methylase
MPKFANDLHVTLDVANVNQLDAIADIAAISKTLFDSKGIDSVRLDLAGDGSFSSVIGSGGFGALENTLSDIRAQNLEAVLSIDLYQAQQLVSSGLEFNTLDTIVLDAQPDLNVAGTHLSTSLKDLQRLGVDAVSVAAGVDAVSLDLGTYGGQMQSVLPSFASETAGKDIQVTLDAQFGQLGEVAGMASTDTFKGTGIDTVRVDAADGWDGVSWYGVVDSSLDLALKELHADGLNLSIQLDQQDVLGLANAVRADGVTGFAFADQDQVTLDASSGGYGTHLSTSLKDLQKLGVDAVSATGMLDVNGNGSNSISLDLGGSLTSAAGLPLFGDNNGDGELSAAERALNVTLDVSVSDVGSLGEFAKELAASGIDAVRVGVGSEQDLLGFLREGADIKQLQTAELDVGVGVSVGDWYNQSTLSLDAGAFELHTDSKGVETIELNAGVVGEGTHLSTSLKDLQRLGVDAVSVAAGVDAVSLDLGTYGGQMQSVLPSFASETAGKDIQVTLDAQFGQLGEVAGMASTDTFKGTGIDTVRVDAADGWDGVSWYGVVDSSLDLALKELHADGLNLSIQLDQQDVLGLANAVRADGVTGFAFADQDQVTLDASSGGYGTHLSTSLKDLQKLGVDAVTTNHQAMVVDMGNATALSSIGLPVFGDTNLNGKLDGNEDSALDVTLNIHGANLDKVGELANSLANAGVDHLGVSSTEFGSDLGDILSLINRGVDLNGNTLDVQLQINNPALVVNQLPTAQRMEDVTDLVSLGLDLLPSSMLASDAHWGDLINALKDAGLGNVLVESTASVRISDDLSAALYESGMLHALPDANIEIDAGSNTILNTSLKAMADLGVDKVNTDHKVYVGLGLQDLKDLADVQDLFSAFGLDSPATDTHLFGKHGAGLVVDQTTFDTLGKSGIEELVGNLTKLGFTEIDVVGEGSTGSAYSITPQTVVFTEVKALGAAADDLAALFDPTHMFDKNVK